jgi:hypothetical protein
MAKAAVFKGENVAIMQWEKCVYSFGSNILTVFSDQRYIDSVPRKNEHGKYIFGENGRGQN